MDAYVTITPKFQVHLPVKLREKAGFIKHGLAKAKAVKGKITITPIKDDILSLAGKYKIKHPIPADKIRDYIDYSNL